MNCQDVRASLLAGEASDKIAAHLDGCVECRPAVATIDHARSDLQSESMWVEPPEGLGDSIVAAISGARDTEPEPIAVQAADTESPRFSSRTVKVIVSSVAAVLILIVGVFAASSRRPPPDWEATMAGTDISPSASAVVVGWNMDAGTRVVLEASDLGPAPDGFVYQLWFSSASQDVSAGTFTDPRHVELTVGIARKDYPTVWLALQPIDTGGGDAGPALLVTTDA